MKTKKTLCICLTVIAVIAAFTGAVRLWRSDAAYQVDAADARQQIAEAQKLMLAAERLGQTDQTYTALGAPTRTAYDDPMFTDGLYEMVDAYRDENRLYSGVSALAALPEMRFCPAPATPPSWRRRRPSMKTSFRPRRTPGITRRYPTAFCSASVFWAWPWALSC